MIDLDAAIAHNIRGQMRKQNMTAVEISTAIQMPEPELRQILSGARCLNAKEICRLATCLGMTVAELMSVREGTETDGLKYLMKNAHTDAAREALEIADELADMIIFHANVMENAKAMMAVTEI